jgi:hypothetical protein
MALKLTLAENEPTLWLLAIFDTAGEVILAGTSRLTN